jgi:hypothetical protein
MYSGDRQYAGYIVPENVYPRTGEGRERKEKVKKNYFCFSTRAKDQALSFLRRYVQFLPQLPL